MSERTLRRPDQGEGTGPEAFDHDVHLRPVLGIAGALFGAMALVALLMWWMVAGFESFDERRDPEPTPIERQVESPGEPPAPRLQDAPAHDLGLMREEEDERLDHAAWVDRAQGTVRIPIDLAIEAYVAGARPRAGAVPPPAAPAGAAQPPTEAPPP